MTVLRSRPFITVTLNWKNCRSGVVGKEGEVVVGVAKQAVQYSNTELEELP